MTGAAPINEPAKKNENPIAEIMKYEPKTNRKPYLFIYLFP